MLEKMQSEKIIISSLKHTQKAFLMKDLLVSAWASYQHLPIKLSQALLCGSIFWFLTERQRETLLALSFPSLPRPGTGFWIRTNGIRLFGAVKSSTSLSPRTLSPTAFSWMRLCSPTSVRSRTICPMSSLWQTHLSPALYPICEPLSPMSLSSPCLSDSHSHPVFLFVRLSSRGVNVLFPTARAVPLHCLSHPSCNYGNRHATMLGNIIMLAQREISLLPAEWRARTDSLLDNFNML